MSQNSQRFHSDVMSRRVQAGQYKCRVLTGVLIIFMVIYFRHRHWFFMHNEIFIPRYEFLDLKDYPDLGITTAEAFPADGELRVPKIIHQTWKDELIPPAYVEWMKTWIRNHPDWTYMFWSDESARQLINDKRPELLSTYDSYSESIRRADALRYGILYEYGGVYADMDMESLLPLDDIVRKYSCILPQEPYEHPILDKNSENLAINAFMACRAKHPFMKRLVENLPQYSHMWSVLDSTGPHYLTLHYKNYIRETELDPAHDDGVYLAPSEYFVPTLDPTKFPYFREWCARFHERTHLQKRACLTLKHRGLDRKPQTFSFTNHHWSHTYFDSSRLSLSQPVNVFEISPNNIKMYKTNDVKI